MNETASLGRVAIDYGSTGTGTNGVSGTASDGDTAQLLNKGPG